MAENIKNQHSNKFLDLRGVEILWNKVKEQIKTTADNAAAAAKLQSVSYNSSDDNITVQVGDISKTVEISKASASNNGLMSKEDFSKLAGIEAGAQVNVIEGVAVRGNGKSAQLPVMEVDGADYSVSVLDVESDLSKVNAESDPLHIASAYAAKVYADGLAQSAKDARDILSGKIDTVSDVAKANADAIATLQATASTHALASDLNNVSASVAANAKAIADHAKEFTTYKGTVSDNLSALESRVSTTATALATRVTTLEGTSTSHASLLAGLRTDVDANATAVSNAVSGAAHALATAKQELETKINTTSASIAVLNGKATVTGSVDYKVKTAIDAAIDAVVDDAPTAFDTLKEVATWISTETSGAAALAQRISDLESNKLDASAFESFEDENDKALATKTDKTDFQNYVSQNNAAVAKKAETSYVNTELTKKVNNSDFETFKTNNTKAINDAIDDEADAREAADKDIKAAAVTSISSSYAKGELSINYAFIDPANDTSFVLCQSISDTELDALFV